MADDSPTPNAAAAPPTGVQPALAPPSPVPPADAAVKPLPPPRTPPSPERVVAQRRRLDYFLVGLVLVFAFVSGLFTAHNSDFFLHAASGRLIAHGDFRPLTGVDPFSFASNGAYWVNTNWLYDLIVYLFYDTSPFGGTILVVLKALMIVALAEVMLRTGREPGRPLWIPVCCVALAVLTLSPRAHLQPIVVSFLFLGVTYWLLHQPRRRRDALAPAPEPERRGKRAAAREHLPPRLFLPYWLIPPLCLLWANLDSWFFLGPLTVGLYLVGELLQEMMAPAGRGRAFWAPGERRTLLWVLPACVAACLINPFHVWAFTPPAALGLSPAAGALGADAQFRGLFHSPFEGLYLNPAFGLSVAGLAFYVLALLGLASFVAAQWVGRWQWERALVWVVFLLLAAWRASTIPFFAVVAGPIASMNFLDFAATRPTAEGRTRPLPVSFCILMWLFAGVNLLAATGLGLAGFWPGGDRGWAMLAGVVALIGAVLATAGQAGSWGVSGRILTALVGVALIVLAVPGWLQAQQPTPWRWRRVGWTVEPDPSLVRVMDRIRSWQKDDGLESRARWFNDSPVVLPYLAWYCPGELGSIDAARLPLYGDSAEAYKRLRESLALKDGDFGKADPRWRKLLRSFDAHFLICYQPDPLALRSNGMLPSNETLLTLLQAPEDWPLTEEWPLLYADGPVSVFGWRDPAEGESPLVAAVRTAAATAPPGALRAAQGVLSDRFLRYEVPAEREAFGPAAVPLPPWTEPPAPPWWAVLWTPETPRPPQTDEAAVQLERFGGMKQRWVAQVRGRWKDFWQIIDRLTQSDAAAVYVGSGCSPSGPLDLAMLKRLLTPEKEPEGDPEKRLPPFPTSPDQPSFAWLRRQMDLGPPAPLYLAVRAARRAVAAKPDDPQPYLLLAQTYETLLYQTREGDRTMMVAYPPGYVPFPLLLRQLQIKAALHQALELDPDNAMALDLAQDIYRRTGFLDLAFTYQQHELEVLGQSGKDVAELGKSVNAVKEQMEKKQNLYLLKSANKRVAEKVQTALQMGLGQTALDELQKVEWNVPDDKDPTRPFLVLQYLNLLMQTGQVDDVVKELKDDEDKLHASLGFDATVGMPAYDWLRVESAAARGDYADADRWLNVMETTMRGDTAQLRLGLTLQLAGSRFLRGASAAGSPGWAPVSPADNVRDSAVLFQGDELILEGLGRAADLEAVRGWLALESGDVPAARARIDAALNPPRTADEAAQDKALDLPAPDQMYFRARPLAELCREWLDKGK